MKMEYPPYLSMTLSSRYLLSKTQDTQHDCLQRTDETLNTILQFKFYYKLLS